MAKPTEDDQKTASGLISKWQAEKGLPVRWETIRTDVISALAAEREKAAKGDGTAIVVAILYLTQADENFHIAWNHSSKMWRFTSSWLDIDLANKSLLPLLEEAVGAIKKAKE